MEINTLFLAMSMIARESHLSIVMVYQSKHVIPDLIEIRYTFVCRFKIFPSLPHLQSACCVKNNKILEINL